MSEAGSHEEMGTTAVGLYDFDGVREDNLPFRRGEIITIVEMNETGWWKGVNSAGKVGIFPYNYVEPTKDDTVEDYRIVKAVVGYTAEDEEELSFNTGALITVLRAIDDEWSFGRIYSLDGETDRLNSRIVGKFQMNYVEETDEVDSKAAEEEEIIVEENERKNVKSVNELQAESFKIEQENEKRYEEMEKENLDHQRILEEQARKAAAEEARIQRETLKREKKALEEEQNKLADEMMRLKKEMENLARVAEEARQRAERAEEDLVASKAEKERLRIQQEKRLSRVDPQAMERVTKKSDIVAKKFEETATQYNAQTPPPMPERKKAYKAPPRFAKLGQSAEKCKKCDKAVGFGPTGMKALNASWHKDCFQCGTCSKVLRSGWLEHDGSPYCSKCHMAGFGIKGFGFGGAVSGNYKGGN